MKSQFRTSSVLVLSAVITCLGLLSSGGCSSLKADVPFKYAASLRSGEPIAGKALFRLIEDKRSKDDRNSTREITDCTEKLTGKLVDDFRTTRMFPDVDYAVGTSECDYVITGTLDEF